MDIGSLLLILALLVVVGFFVAQPFFERKYTSSTVTTNPKDHELSSLLAERDRVINALQELDFDNTLGKIPAEDYAGQRQRLLEYGANILRQIDELQSVSGLAAPGVFTSNAEDRIEAAIAARRADSAHANAQSIQAETAQVDHGGAVRPGVTARVGANGGKVVSAAVAAPDDDLEVMLANRRRSSNGDTAGFCPNCGCALQKDDKFCPKCGTKVK